MKILVLEPSRVQQIILNAMFRACDLYPEFVASLASAMSEVDKAEYDCVFTSYSLKEGSGVDIARHLKRTNNTKTSVILLTTEDRRTILNDALSAGITRIIPRANTVELETFIRELADSDVDYQQMSGKVLFIDDDRTMTAIICSMIEASGSECISCTNGEEAMALIADNHFDLVIADYFLDGKLTGLDTLLAIRQMGGKRARTPVMVISAQTDVERRIEILKKGANDYVAKPVVEEELVVRANNLITQKKLFDRVEEQREQLRNMAMTDQLTALYNRHFLVEFAPKRLAEAMRHKTDLSLMVVDLDHFKAINDTHGHDRGDQVLREVADILKSVCRKEDMAIRLGGEEFLLILPHCSAEGVIKKAEELRLLLLKTRPARLDVTGSFGITCLEGGNQADFSDLFTAADEAVYEAKDTGRNKVIFRAVASPE
ncbi:diguanylate cyclase [Pleionea mediterranea]|uniref:diguanylate cyclase n=1 Tax=Pleionea mediterranea TaxID=523701 RepID=A0A316FHS9_9GAMM|nr:diguanylate cyclase [Pleionea mediterranea]PWK47276.1 two-component system cell cycle response regulator [Pleionea mediterranea]